MTARIRLLASIYLIMCGGCLVVGTVLCLGLLLSRDPRSGPALAFIGGAFGTLSVFYFIPGLLGGLGLLQGRAWARVVIIVLSLLVIFVFPVGTALAGFGLWVLLGPEWKQMADLPAPERPWESALRALAFRPANLPAYRGLFVAAAGVAAAFVVTIGTGYRVTRTAGSPISDVAYITAIVVLVLAAAFAAWNVSFRRAAPETVPRGPMASRGDRERMAEERRRGEEERRRRLETLAADPLRHVYAERIRRGEAWSDAQIEYDLTPDRLATCEHLQPIERAMRAAGIEVRLRLGSKISARCRVDAEALAARFVLAPSVSYAEPQPVGRAYEDPLPAVITCSACTSEIDVVHRVDAPPGTPVFPMAAEPHRADAPSPVDPPTNRFTQLRGRIAALARIIDAPAEVIPTYGQSVGNGLPHIEIEGDTYHYVHEERGQEFDRFATTSEEELLYRVFRDVAWSVASILARPHRQPGEDFRRALFAQQLLVLRRLNAAWASRCAVEHEEVLAKHPFVDGR